MHTTGKIVRTIYTYGDKNGTYLGSYFNVVKNTQITDELVSFEDLIIDILVLPSGEYFILDEDELPESLEEFEDGYVNEALNVLEEIIQKTLPQMIVETERVRLN